ncbi:uncharacterized protein LOC102568737 isoform X8 [Alligator mississippiensis]|nr:uncharacterized protein LOC102568737 isoform X8 [Alligator mississippiensis]XP_059574730.1 uncharacterized protein LOC102568737 isoform X8 [Alligator mississippiensis]XP_059574731.1 uncharacterized protein LOC102568737 isoform X8 [Alligator mississippiensis]XP_059574732.1 uncharacterized protein LOC102568737 isoform X8 [Alligator mississippiensis]XP_059574733.1 uncharacterized protein LOC102568737 isoform X8 [Alligator mississippiensis]
MEPLSLLLCWALLGVACAGEDAPVHYEEPKERDPFTYDYQSLRIGGLIFAVILFLLGILIIFSRRCRCKFNQQQRTGEPDEEEGTLRSSIRRYRDSGDPFKYDYDTLRLVGLVLAIVMFVLGILTALSRKFKCKQSESSLSADPQRTATSGAGCRPLRAMMGPGCRPPASLHAGSPRHRPVHDPSFAPKTPLPQEGVPGTPNTPPLQSLGGQGPVLVGGGGQMLL